MKKTLKSKIYLFIILIALLFVSIASVFGADNGGTDTISTKLSSDTNLCGSVLTNSIDKSTTNVSVKYKKVSKSKIVSVSVSNNVVKAGKVIRIKVYPKGYLKSVYFTIDGEKSYFPNNPKFNFKKSSYGY